MKIIQIMPEFGLAGAEIMCENLTYELQKHGHTVIVLSMYDYHSPITERMERAGIDVRYLGKKPGLDFSMIRKMRKIFRAEHPDVIHTHRYTPEYAVPAAVLAGVRCKIHTVHSVAEKENSCTARKVNRFFFKHMHVIPVALSEKVKGTIMKVYNIEANQVPVVYNGVSLDKCIKKDNYAIGKKISLLHIGRFNEAKNHIELLKAIKRLHGNNVNIFLRLVGEGELKEFIAAYIVENQMTEYVELYGTSNNVFPLIANADIFLLPSIYEGIPMTLIEAMGSGMPVIASCVGGIPDMIMDGVSGLLCEPNADSIMKKIEMFLSDEQLRKNCGCNALKAVQKFSAATMYEGYKVLYENKTDK